MKTYINPETTVTRIAPIVMVATSGQMDTSSMTQTGFKTTEDTEGNFSKGMGGGSNLWDD